MNKIQKFLNQYDTSTRKTYGYHLKLYFKVINANPDTYFSQKRNYEADIDKFWKHQKQYTKSICSRNGRVNAVKQLLIENDIELSQKFWKKLKRSTKDKGNKPITLDRTPTRYELRRIILEGKPIGRAISLIASSSGMRLGEIVQLLPEDIDLYHDPPMINIRGEFTKNGESRTAFISNEAKDAIIKWNKIRDKWIIDAKKKLRGLSDYDYLKDKRIFPVNKTTVDVYWNRMLERANLNKRDPSTNRYVLHFHVLRKYFRTNMAKPLGLDVTEALLGHSGYLTDAYRRYSVEDLGEMYKEAVNAVNVFVEEPNDLSGVNEQLKEKDQQVKDLLAKQEMMETRIGQMETLLELKNMKIDQEKMKKKIKSL